jgi:uncharacterized protein with FMN-binding domain
MNRRPVGLAAAAAVGLAGVLAFHSSTPAALIAPSGRRSTSQSPPNSTPPGLATGPTRSALGKLEQYGYGELAVQVTVRGGHITSLSVKNLRTAESYSQSLATQVTPMLRNEVLSAQSARINAISGATYTSEAYAYSVQSALDHLHVK